MRSGLKVGFALGLALLALLAACGSAGEPPTTAPGPAAAPTSTVAPDPTEAPTPVPAPTAMPTAAPEPEPTAAPEPEPTAAPEPTLTPEPTVAPAPSPTVVPPPKEEEVLNIIYWQAPTIPFPYLSGGFKDRDAAAITLEPLAEYNPDGELVPVLASEIPTLENGGVSADLTSVTWRLKEGVRWSDGLPLTGGDVAFTSRYCMDDEAGCTGVAFDHVASVEALDELTVRVTFDAPTPFPHTVFVGSGSPIISEAQFGECEGAPARDCVAHNHRPVGTGPYRIVEFTPDEEAVYERNPFYRGGTPYFDRVVLHGGGDALTAARAVLETGDADYAWNLQIEPGLLRELAAEGPGTVVSGFSSLIERIVVNQTNPDPALGDDRSEYMDGMNPHPLLTFTPIPQAMSMAIDRAAISRELYGFSGKPSCNLIAAPANYVSTANEGCLSQDIEGANRLLDENNVLDTDGDGIREYEGVPLRITYQTSENDVRRRTQVLVRGWWRQIGIEAELVQHDPAVFFGGDPAVSPESYARFFADVQMYASGPGVDPQEHLGGLICGDIPARDNNWSGSNVARACNPEFDQLYDRLTHTPIGPERDDLVKQLHDIVVGNYYQIPLVNRGSVSAHLNSLRGVRINAWDSEMWNIADWRR